MLQRAARWNFLILNLDDLSLPYFIPLKWVTKVRACKMGCAGCTYPDRWNPLPSRHPSSSPPASSSCDAILRERFETKPERIREMKRRRFFCENCIECACSINQRLSRCETYAAERHALWMRWFMLFGDSERLPLSILNLTCKTRLGKPVFCDNCLRSLASGLWLIAKYDFIVRNWWCLNDVLIRFVRDDALPMLPRPKPKSIYSELRSERKRNVYKLQLLRQDLRQDDCTFFSLLILWFIVAWSLFN